MWWGTKTETKEVGDFGIYNCDICRGDQPHSLVVRYQRDHIYFFIQWVSDVKHYMLCNRCNNGVEVANHVATQINGKPTIPWIQRYAWLVTISLIGVVVFGASLSGSL